MIFRLARPDSSDEVSPRVFSALRLVGGSAEHSASAVAQVVVALLFSDQRGPGGLGETNSLLKSGLRLIDCKQG